MTGGRQEPALQERHRPLHLDPGHFRRRHHHVQHLRHRRRPQGQLHHQRLLQRGGTHDRHRHQPSLPAGTSKVLTGGQSGKQLKCVRVVKLPDGTVLHKDKFISTYPMVPADRSRWERRRPPRRRNRPRPLRPAGRRRPPSRRPPRRRLRTPAPPTSRASSSSPPRRRGTAGVRRTRPRGNPAPVRRTPRTPPCGWAGRVGPPARYRSSPACT